MDFSRWAEIQPQHQRPADTHISYNAAGTHLHHSQQQQPQPPQQQLPSSSSSYAYQSNPNPNPNPNPTPTSIHIYESYDLDVEPYTPTPYAAHAAYKDQTLLHRYSAGASASSYYHSAAGATQGFSVKHSIWQYGEFPLASGVAIARPPNGVHPVSSAQVNPISQFNQVSRPSHDWATKKRAKKPAKVVQSAYCNVCKIDCNSMDVLNSHRQGKKHKKNLEKLKESIAGRPTTSLTATVDKKEAPKDTNKCETSNNQTKKKARPATDDDLKAKKRRVVEGGTAEDAVKVCTLCNVVCNSEMVYNSHIAGQKHNTMVKKQAEATASLIEDAP